MSSRVEMKRFYWFIIYSLFLAPHSFAAPGPGVPNNSYPPGAVGQFISDDAGYQEDIPGFGTAPPGVICSDLGRTALLAFHQGYVFAGYEAPASMPNSNPGQCVINISDPRSPIIQDRFYNTTQGLNAHGVSKLGEKLHLARFYTVEDDGSISSTTPFWTNYGSYTRGGQFARWAVDFKWSYNPASGPHLIYEGEAKTRAELIENKVAEIDVVGDTGILTAHPFILGNLAVFASDQTDKGVAVYDLSDLSSPRLLDYLNAGIGIGGYWVGLWKHYLIFPRRRSSSIDPTKDGVVHIVDFEDPANLRYVAEIPIDGNPQYPQMQDNFLFVDSTKIDLSPLDVGGAPVVVQEFDEDSVGLDTSQYLLPVGNLLVTGGLFSGGNVQGVGVWVHQAERDERCPEVAYHWPQDGQTDFPVTAPLSLMIHETLETSNLALGTTFRVREVGGVDVSGHILYSDLDILSFNPLANFRPGTEYEVILTEDAFTDAVGNPICDRDPEAGVAYRFRFTTSDGSNPLPTISNFTLDSSSPAVVGAGVRLSFDAADNNHLEYRLDYGEGAPRTAWTPAGSTTLGASAVHKYTEPGIYRVLLQVREVGSLTRLTSETTTVVIQSSGSIPRAAISSEMSLDETRKILWVVNPDNDSVSQLDTDSHALIREISGCEHPTSVSLSDDGSAWVTCRDSDEIIAYSPSGTVVQTIQLDYGSRPISILMNGASGFAALEGSSDIIEVPSAAYLPKKKGLNYEFYSWFGSQSIPGLSTLSELSPDKFTRRFTGIWHDVTHELRRYFEGTHPQSQLVGVQGVFSKFAMVYRGQVEVPLSGEYTFHLRASGNNEANLRLGNVVDLFVPTGGQMAREVSQTVTLAAGKQDIVVKYLSPIQNARSHLLEVEWEGPGISRQRIPPSAYTPALENRRPRALAINPSNDTLFVSQFISDDHAGKISTIDLATRQYGLETLLFADEKTVDSGAKARGVPNYIRGLTVSPDGETLWFASKKDNWFAGEVRDKESVVSTHETSVRALLGQADLTTRRTTTASDPNEFYSYSYDAFDRALNLDIDNHALPSHVVYDPTGTKLFVTLQANNELLVVAANTLDEVERIQVGLSPTAVVIDSQSRKIFVKNFLARTVSIYDGTDLINTAARGLASKELAVVSTVQREKLRSTVLLGKQLFYSARDLDNHAANPSRMSLDGYLSCATCHLDGDTDGRVLDRKHLGEGYRRTTSLRGRGGVSHGRIHWSGNFDEIQDFELDMTQAFGGRGFLETVGGPNPSLGAANAGRDPHLDALAAYVNSLGKGSVPRSPFRNADGSMTSEALAGQTLFQTSDCVTCHIPEQGYTDSRSGALHDVGTLKMTSGMRLGAPLSGIDTPTLLGLHASGPFLHDGSAPTLEAVFEQSDSPAHDLSAFSPLQREQLFQFLLQLDGTNIFTPNAPGNLRIR